MAAVLLNVSSAVNRRIVAGADRGAAHPAGAPAVAPPRVTDRRVRIAASPRGIPVLKTYRGPVPIHSSDKVKAMKLFCSSAAGLILVALGIPALAQTPARPA